MIKQLHHDGYIEFKDGTPFRRYFEDEEGAEHDPFYCFMEVDWASTSEVGKLELSELIGENHGFDTVKPTRLLRTLIQSCTRADDLVLDFFGGSGTTGQAVLDLNRENQGKRRFILVQLPEVTGKIDFPRITDITKERIRRVISKGNEDAGSQLGLIAQEQGGFRVLKLDSSNFRPWDGTQPESVGSISTQLELHVDHVLSGRSQEDILAELLLKSGFPLSTKVEAIQLAGKQVFSVEDGAMLVCLDATLTPEVIKAMAEKKPSRVICLDAGFQGNDQLKTNAVQTMKARGVLKFQTV